VATLSAACRRLLHDLRPRLATSLMAHKASTELPRSNRRAFSAGVLWRSSVSSSTRSSAWDGQRTACQQSPPSRHRRSGRSYRPSVFRRRRLLPQARDTPPMCIRAHQGCWLLPQARDTPPICIRAHQGCWLLLPPSGRMGRPYSFVTAISLCDERIFGFGIAPFAPWRSSYRSERPSPSASTTRSGSQPAKQWTSVLSPLCVTERLGFRS
jgi:hypothetical protein